MEQSVQQVIETTALGPIFYLIGGGLMVFLTLGGILLYWFSLRGWIQSARRPFGLRLLVTWCVVGAYLVVALRFWFWSLLISLGWGEPLFDVPLLFWIVLAVWIVSLGVVFTIARKSYA
jgi:hypothetical protein